jgi:hypothetical protein
LNTVYSPGLEFVVRLIDPGVFAHFSRSIAGQYIWRATVPLIQAATCVDQIGADLEGGEKPDSMVVGKVAASEMHTLSVMACPVITNQLAGEVVYCFARCRAASSAATLPSDRPLARSSNVR